MFSDLICGVDDDVGVVTQAPVPARRGQGEVGRGDGIGAQPQDVSHQRVRVEVSGEEVGIGSSLILRRFETG